MREKMRMMVRPRRCIRSSPSASRAGGPRRRWCWPLPLCLSSAPSPLSKQTGVGRATIEGDGR